ncbi:MAG: YihY/virulence factor BrkB family protein [Planctomycetes bacterium]|nr:YihY/virulence factor BrkB family protein [Planctomycetota bacterium]
MPRFLRAFMHFREKDASYYAAGIAFYLLFALTPFLLLTLSVAACFATSSSTYLDVFDTFFKENLPQVAQPIRDSLVHVFENRGQIGIVGLIWLFLTAKKLVNAIEIGLNAVLGIEKPKSGVFSTLASMALIFVGAILFLGCVLSTIAIDFALGTKVSFVNGEVRAVAAMIATSLVMGSVWFGIFFAIFRLAPAKGLEGHDGLVAAAATTVMWIGARQGFVWYGAKQLARYQYLYGALSGFLLLLLFAYIFGISLLMGACVAHKK